MNSLNRFADPVYCIMRVIVGLMFACHGAQKILGLFAKPGQVYAWLFFFMFFYGPGRLSVDAMMRGGSAPNSSTA